MSFEQNTSNQAAPPTQSESEANFSPPAPRENEVLTLSIIGVRGGSHWNFNIRPYYHSLYLPSMVPGISIITPRERRAYVNVRSVDAASLGREFNNQDDLFAPYNDGDLNLLEEELISSFSDLELNRANESYSNEDPLVRNYLPDLYSSVNSKQFSKSDLIELLDSSCDGLSQEATRDFQRSTAQLKEMMARLKAQDIVLKYLAAEFPKHGYCHVFKGKLMTLKSFIDIITRYIGLNIHQIDHMEAGFKAISASIARNIETLKTWDSMECFLCGQSEKFANVVCAKDLLPQNGPTTCGICLSTIEETSDFAVQSDCTHIFCTPCIATWFETKQDCPMCRQRGLFMSKDRLLELRSSGPEPAH